MTGYGHRGFGSIGETSTNSQFGDPARTLAMMALMFDAKVGASA